ncbi:MAG TPA: nucleotidyl transferase AbiEii/AbiGii toxin family protein [Polyangiaceae bacterium]|nr:nucleotidyl transferase AbiEii/AbiGii toxin family protein [Polyangiaceae bacterium]
MNALEAALRRIAGELARANLGWALIGGLAVSARAEPRTTRDVDVAVSVADDSDAEGFVLALQSAGFRVLAALEQEAARRLATVRVVPPGEDAGGVVVDLLFASSGIEPELVARAERMEILPGLTVPVARIGHLLALKVLARDDRRRPQDLDDLRALLREAEEADVAEARTALTLIEARGFQRERRLREAFEQLLISEAT